MFRRFHVATAVMLAIVSFAHAQSRDEKVRGDRRTVETAGYWIYNDLPAAIAQGKNTGKPLLVAIRCIPCEACAQLDAQMVERDPVAGKLLDQFVCVRLIHMNGLDLRLFQYDYDQSLAAFALNADRTIYGRYGTRSHETESVDDVSVEGFARFLEKVLELHQAYPGNKDALAAKHGPAPVVATPEEFPSLKGRFTSTLDEKGQIAKSCIHCHQVGEALRQVHRDKDEPIPDEVLFPYPLPNALGLKMDPRQAARVLDVAEGSCAANAGFRAGDDLVTLEGQALTSIADIQWVLQSSGKKPALKAVVDRNGKRQDVTLELKPDWRRNGDISWRATSWDLRRMTTGGMRLDALPSEARTKLGLSEQTMALVARHVGEYGAHAAAKNAGFRKGDVLIEVGGRSDLMTESQMMSWLVNARQKGDKVPVVILREGKRIPLELPMQ
jgi:hypothetical protein